MAEKRDTSADHRTFSQRYGYEPLPEPMRLEHISEDLRREIWNVTLHFFQIDFAVDLSHAMGMLGSVPDDQKLRSSSEMCLENFSKCLMTKLIAVSFLMSSMPTSRK